jgi:hypothetical protein
MSGAVEVSLANKRPRRERLSDVEATAETCVEPILLTTPLERISSRRRKTHAATLFSSLSIKCKKDLYSRAPVLA